VTGLRAITWLQGLGEDEWAALESSATRLEFAAGETVFAPTPDPKSIYLLEDGSIRILRRSGGGDEVTLGYVNAGEALGELPGFGDYQRESFAIARSPSIVWRIAVSVFQQLIVVHPSIAVGLIRQIGDRMKRVESRVENLVFGDVRSRLAMVLLELADNHGHRENGYCVIDLDLSQGELAMLIGSTRQSVNAAIGGLREDGLLRLDGRRTELLDLERLREIGKSNGR